FSTIIEIRSYNSRYLDIAMRVSRGYLLLEDKIKGMISDWQPQMVLSHRKKQKRMLMPVGLL
ncbi:MAG: hypothetical protein JRD05_04025, partial [Deltaproteobacteria bacterium]|nr:hypothetical protein [Deltaproteobacteria bacterium]